MLLFVLLSEWWVNMSLLKAIEEAEAVVASLKELLGESVAEEVVTEPWYHNIPKEGVECWVDDARGTVTKERDAGYYSTRTVYNYNPNEDMPFEALVFRGRFDDPDNMVDWKYAIPVDPNLRLPNGAITL
jgi:hypothetical protein